MQNAASLISSWRNAHVTAGQRRVPSVDKILVLIDREEQITHRPRFDVIILRNHAHLISVRRHQRQCQKVPLST